MSTSGSGGRARAGRLRLPGAHRSVRHGVWRSIRAALAVVFLAAASACAPKMAIQTEVADPAPDFAALRSFAILTEVDRDAELDAAIEGEIRRALVARGLEEVAPTDAQALVAYRAHAVDLSKRRLDSDPDANSYRIVHYVEGTLVIDVFDAGARRRIWHGEAVVDESNRERLGKRKLEAVAELLSKFPAGL